MKVKTVKDACAVAAVWYCAGAPDEETVFRISRAFCNFKEDGMTDTEWQALAKHFGISVRKVPFEEMKLRKFKKEFKEGLYFVSTHDHLFVVDNGIIIDPRNKKPPGLDRIIKWAWKATRG